MAQPTGEHMVPVAAAMSRSSSTLDPVADDLSPLSTRSSTSSMIDELRDSEGHEAAQSLTMGSVVALIWPLFMIAVMEQTIASTRDTVYFPFLRTLIDCENATAVDFDRSSRDWSGSPHCSNRCLVAEEAQLLRGISGSVEQTVQCLTMPILGVLADSFGRKSVCLYSIAGLGISVYLYAGAAFAGKGQLAHMLVIGGGVVKGLTEALFMLIYAMVADTYETADERGMVYSMMQTIKASCAALLVGGITMLVLSANLNNYAFVFFVLGTMALLVCAVASCVMQETLPEEQRHPWSWKRASPMQHVRFFWDKPHLAMMAGIIFLFVCGISVLVIIQAFVIAAYGWTQTTSMMVLVAIGGFAVMSVACGFVLIARFGARVCLVLSLTLATIGTGCLSLSTYGPSFLFIGGLTLAASSFGNPAYLAVVSEMVPPAQQAQLQGGIGACALLASALAMPMYSAIFNHFGAGGDCHDGKSGDWTWLPFTIACCFMIPADVLLVYWVRLYPIGSFRSRESGGSDEAQEADAVEQSSGADASQPLPAGQKRIEATVEVELEEPTTGPGTVN